MGESRELRCPAQLDSHHVSQERLDASVACSNGELPKSSAAGVQRMKRQMRCRKGISHRCLQTLRCVRHTWSLLLEMSLP
jgi:hypothetical protein